MKSILPRPWVAAAALGVSLAMVAGPALADSVTITDPDDDAFVIVDDTVEVGDYDIDLRSVRVDHRVTDLVVTSTFSFTNADSWTDSFLDVDTDLDGRTDHRALWSKGNVAGVVTVNPDGSVGTATCTNVGMSEQYGVNGTTTLTVPRTCLGNPAKVAVHLDVFWFGTNTSGADLTFVDSAPGLLIDEPTSFTPPVAVDAVVVAPSPGAPAPVSSAVSVGLSKKTQKVGGAPVKLRIQVAGGAAGTVEVTDGGKTLRTLSVSAGQAVSYKLPRRLKAGAHRIKVSFTPADPTRATASSKVVKVRVLR